MIAPKKQKNYGGMHVYEQSCVYDDERIGRGDGGLVQLGQLHNHFFFFLLESSIPSQSEQKAAGVSEAGELRRYRTGLK